MGNCFLVGGLQETYFDLVYFDVTLPAQVAIGTDGG